VKKNIVKIVTFVAGLFFLLEFMLPARAPAWLGGFENPLSLSFGTVNNFLMVLTGMAVFLGPINLTRSELKQIIRRRKGWYESVIYMVALLIAFVAAGLRSDTPNDQFTRVMSITYDVLLYGISMAFYITSMGLVSFYLVSAAHRAFLLNTVESALMMLAASIVMLGLTPAGDFLNQFFPSWLQIGSVAQWILSTPNTAVQKAVLFGACGGAFAAAMRNWLSIGKRGE
jgi:hypothetical protein